VSGSNQSAGRRLRLITIDQAIAGASNVLAAVLAARLLGVASFGLFGILFLIYTIVIGVSRALVSDPLLVHPVEAEQRPGDVIATSCMLGIGLGAVVLVAGFAAHPWNPSLGNALMALSVCVPLLVLQDLGRYFAFATQRPTRAVALDLAWLLIMFGAVAALFITNTRTLAGFIVAWAGSGAAAGLLLFWQYRGLEIGLGFSWLRHTWTFSWRYLISYTSTQGAALAASSGVGAVAGARALGGVQGAMLLVRPFMTFQVAATAASIGEVTRASAESRRLRRHATRTSALTTGIALGNAVVLVVLPDRLGEIVLGASWHAVKPLLLATGVQIICLGLLTGMRAGLLGMRAIRQVMARDVATTVVVLVATVCGAIVNGAKGALWAVALGQGLMAVIWWMTFWTRTSSAHATAAGAVLSPLPPATVPSRPSA
jgi:O-antigen/teichoic acid export membrane protein